MRLHAVFMKKIKLLLPLNFHKVATKISLQTATLALQQSKNYVCGLAGEDDSLFDLMESYN